MGDENELTIAGQILIPAATPFFQDAAAHIRLESLRGEDAPAEVVAETIIEGVRHELSDRDTAVAFTIRIGQGKITAKNDYAVRVWIDLDSDGKPGQGDLYSDERHSVLFDRPARAMSVRVVKR